MAERQIGHRKSSLYLSARFPVAKWRSRSVAHNETGTHGKYEFGHLRKDKATGAVSGIVTGDALVSFRPLLLSLYNYMRNFCNLIGLEQWYLSLIWNTYIWKLQNYCG